MWNWLKKKPRQRDFQLEALTEQLEAPQVLATALAETVDDYVSSVQAGKLSYPAHRREEASVVEIWAALRIEALHKLFNFGQSDPFILSDLRRQGELLSCFLDEQPHLEFPQPRGAVVPDTMQAMFQVYLYLDAVGSEVADRETDRTGLKLEGRSILDHIELQCAELRPRLAAFRPGGGDRILPPTLIELLYADVTVKAKSIALSAKFGPHYESGIKFLENQVSKSGDDPAPFRAAVARVLAAKDPDHLSSDL